MFKASYYRYTHIDRNGVQEFRTLQIRANALQKCNQRNDEFAGSVLGRLQTRIDLVAEEAVYHRTCYQKFLSDEGESNPIGRPFNVDSDNAFNKLCLWLEQSLYLYLAIEQSLMRTTKSLGV